MTDTKYTEKEIEWLASLDYISRSKRGYKPACRQAGELKKKHPERATREQAISLLDTLKGLPKFVVEKIKKDKKSGKLKSPAN